MDYKDTVMSLDNFNEWSKEWHLVNDIPELYMKADWLSSWELAKLEAQVEITWPIAERVGYNKALAQLANMTVEIREDILKQYGRSKQIEECKQIGRKEVVEWVDNNYPIGTPKWFNQKKEWGVSND